MSNLKQYNSFFNKIIQTINSARNEACKSLNKHHIGLNFEIGKLIVKNQVINNSVKEWISKEWTFKKVAYPGRDISGEQWKLIK